VRYVAIGDSFTEGMGDERPDGTPRGWADRVAAGLAAAHGGDVQYANFAIRGRLLEPIVTTQLDAALALTPLPTLITLNGGGNDMMRRGSDLHRLLDLTERAVLRCADAGVRLVVLSGADPSEHLPFGKVLRERAAQLTEAVRELTLRHDLLFVNCFGDAELRRAAYWSGDRLHLNAHGHRRVAGLVLTALDAAGEDYRVPAAAPAGRRLLAEARYYREHVLPWVARRLRGTSSGDGRVAKYPDWTAAAG